MSKFLIPAIIVAGVMAGAAQAQWLDTTLYLGVGSTPCALVYDSLNNKVYCANLGSDNVTAIDGASNQVIATVGAGSGSWALCYIPPDHKVYCANYLSGDVTVIDGASDTVITTVAVGSWPYDLCYNPQDNKVYCADYYSGSLSVIDGASDSLLKTMAVGMEPVAVTCNPVQNRISVADFSSNSISIIRDSPVGGIQERAPLVGRHLTLDAYPNPFSGQIRLRLSTSAGTGTCPYGPELRIYDVNGALVRAFSEIRDSPQRDSPRFLNYGRHSAHGSLRCFAPETTCLATG